MYSFWCGVVEKKEKSPSVGSVRGQVSLKAQTMQIIVEVLPATGRYILPRYHWESGAKVPWNGELGQPVVQNLGKVLFGSISCTLKLFPNLPP